MKKAKILIPAGLAVLSAAALFVSYNFGYVPYFGRSIAEKRLKEYTSRQDPVSFDIYDGYYYTESSSKILYDIRSQRLVDFALTGSESQRIDQMYQDFLGTSQLWNEENGMYPEHMSVSVSMYGNDFQKTYDSLCNTVVYDCFEGTDEETISHMLDVLKEWTDHVKPEFNITSVNFQYGNCEHLYELRVDGRDNIDELDLRKSVHEVTEEREIPLVYTEWKETTAK